MLPTDRLHPQLYELRDADLDPAFLEAARADTPEAWEHVAREIHPGVVALRVLLPEWCVKLSEEIQHVEDLARARGIQLDRPNSMNEYGLVLDEVGFSAAMAALVERLRPLAARCFPAFGGATLDAHHAFCVEYARGRDEDLGFHVDNSEVTLNLCLGEDFAGSELVFRGVRCEGHRQTPCRTGETFEYVHEPGVAVVHAGPHRHQVEPLRRGVRRNLIVWCHSGAWRAAPQPACPDWCGAR